MHQNVKMKAATAFPGVPPHTRLDVQGGSLYDFYNDMFECVVADTDEMIDECYRLRYQVYCVEHPFEEHNPALGEYERDIYDGHAVHALIKHRQSGEYIGCVRLIIDLKDSPKRMPAIELSEENQIKLPNHIYTNPCAEVSRFCISKDFRRRVTDTMYTSAYTPRELAIVRSRVIPFMAIGLMKMVFTLCKEHGMRQCVAVMEPSLIRMLDKLGIHFLPVGNTIEYHGTRQISYITNHKLYASLLNERPDILEVMTDRGESPLIS